MVSPESPQVEAVAERQNPSANSRLRQGYGGLRRTSRLELMARLLAADWLGTLAAEPLESDRHRGSYGRKIMRWFLIVMAVCAVVCGLSVRGIGEEEAKAPAAVKLPPPEKPPAKEKLPPGFKRLFDGKTLKGWKGREGLWKVEDGAIMGQTTPETRLKHNDFLYTEKEYGDFELRLKFRLINHNSGVQIRSKVHKDYRVTGYQADIAERRYTGILYEEGGRGILADVDQKKIAKIVKKGDWNDYRILCQGKRLQFWINGQPTITYTEKKDSAPTKGVIAFQLHGGPPMKVYFKDIIIKDLSKPAAKDAKETAKG